MTALDEEATDTLDETAAAADEATEGVLYPGWYPGLLQVLENWRLGCAAVLTGYWLMLQLLLIAVDAFDDDVDEVDEALDATADMDPAVLELAVVMRLLKYRSGGELLNPVPGLALLLFAGGLLKPLKVVPKLNPAADAL